MRPEIELLHLYISPAHNFFGHHGRPPGENPAIEVPQIKCVAHRGIQGDRFFDYKENYKGQITFIENEAYLAVCESLGIRDKPPSVFRRNVVTNGIDLNSLVGKEFEIQGVRFFGAEPCHPCHWMEHAFAPGAEKALAGRGGLRAKILTSGILRSSRHAGS